MPTIKAVLLKTPSVLLDGESVRLPYRKAEAAFYYLLVNGKASRSELMHLLWGDFPEETARKNLRNALYKIRKTIGEEGILTPNQKELLLNPQWRWSTDLQHFLLEKKDTWKQYQQEFLQGFSVKDAEDFEGWMLKKRQEYEELYLRKLHHEIKKAEEIGDVDEILELGKALIRKDEFDEEARRKVMEAYLQKRQFHKAVQVYEETVQVLKEELGIQPEARTKALYEKVLSQRQPEVLSESRKGKAVIFGREKEWQQLQREVSTFFRKTSPKIIMICGEAGIGKTLLVQKFLESEISPEVEVLESNCYQQEENFLLKPWQPVFSQLATLLEMNEIHLPETWIYQISRQFPIFESLLASGTEKLQERALEEGQGLNLIEAVVGMLKKVTINKKLIFVFEDLHWMDSVSLQLLQRILQEKTLSVLFLITIRDGYENRKASLTAMTRHKSSLVEINLRRFSFEETLKWLEGEAGKEKLDKNDGKKIYNETRGNPFFVAEYINALQTCGSTKKLSVKAQNILQSRLQEMAEETRKLLELISLFFHRVPVSRVAGISSADDMEVAEMLEQLIERGILREVIEENKTSIEFVHQKFRDYVYEQQSLSKRRLLHQRVGIQLEEQLRENTSDVLRYTDLIHHFKQGGDYPRALKYIMKYLNGYLDYYHELFPSAIHLRNLPRQSVFLSREETMVYFDEVEAIMEKMDPEDLQDEEVRFWHLSFLHLKGRLLIREGDYEVGLETTKEMIQLALEAENWDYAMNGYQQIVNYGIQTQQPDIMIQHIDQAMEMAENKCYPDRMPIFLRLKGLYLMMSHDFDEAELVLDEAIKAVSGMETKHRQHVVHVSACRYYKGEIHRNRQEYEQALEEYRKAVDGCSQKDVRHHSIAVFYTGMGLACYQMGKVEKAEEYLVQALDYFREYEIFWRRSIANLYMALIEAEKRNTDTAKKHIDDAQAYARMIKNPYELSVLKRIKKEVQMKTSSFH
ncbi:AAA family ATPase [Tindallia californiensis]|uniref:DNA-binding transcriptional activator of the SARP family n=1 Tax=Tindallia californiensis TaxID=159292 RepID=A0A1H3MI83_9FIRM|nr:AAA family ATPase [Tindallia californiensis]SDY75785.1 DNA-binding transcriptional activator of the SARP family [Tindallia californiensis]